METCNKDQAQEYKNEFGQLAIGRVAGAAATAAETERPTLTDAEYDRVIWPCGD